MRGSDDCGTYLRGPVSRLSAEGAAGTLSSRPGSDARAAVSAIERVLPWPSCPKGRSVEVAWESSSPNRLLLPRAAELPSTMFCGWTTRFEADGEDEVLSSIPTFALRVIMYGGIGVR